MNTESQSGTETNGARMAHSTKIPDCSTVQEIQSTLADLAAREGAVTAQLDALIASQTALSRDLGRLDLLRAHLGSQVVATRSISNGILSNASGTAKRISSAVKKLDIEQENVKATLAMVEQVAELKGCILGVHGSMGAPQDWETAALYLSRASKIPKEVIDGEFAEQTVPTTEVPDPPRVTLENAAESLCGLFLREFEKATNDGDGARITRFFKLFPLIGRAEVGLDAYGSYVCQGVAARARQNINSGTGGSARADGYFYGNALTKLFEHIAQIVDGHEPVVQRHYGPGQMTHVIERLQIEADVQGGIILDSWYEDRGVDRRLTDVRSYAFSFLLQSFLTTQKSSMIRSDSPANWDAGARISEDDSIDMKEIDSLLNESGTMLGRWSLYTRFLATKSSTDDGNQSNGTSKAVSLRMPKYLSNSNLAKKVSNHLLSPFNEMTTFLLRGTLEKAFQLDEMPAGLSLNLSKSIQSQPPYITSAVDDVMYVVAQILQRALGTCQRQVVSSVVPMIGRVLSSEFIGMIQRKMKDEYYPKPIIQGSLPPEDQVLAFLVLINNLDIAVDYIKRIVSSHLNTTAQSDDTGEASTPESLFESSFPFENDASFTVGQIRSMETAFTSKCQDVLSDAIKAIFRQVIKPRTLPMLRETFRDVDYSATSADEGQSDGESDQSEPLVPNRFGSAFNALLRPIKRILTGSTFSSLLSLSIPSFADAIERRIWAMQGRISELGAIRLERDLAGIVAAATRDGRYGLRDSFAKCIEIVMVAGMETDEWEEMLAIEQEGGDHDRDWILDLEERRRARGLVVR
jgi:conserved oligomeric Golgi complex subunit 4